MRLNCRWLLPVQLAAVAAALSAVKPHEADPGQLPHYGWSSGDSFGDGGPQQASGARRLAEGRAVLSRHEELAQANASKPSRFPIHLQARVLLPKAKLAFCYMPKVASAQMTTLFNELNGRHELFWWQMPWESSGPDRLGIDWEDVTREKGWKFAFFHRDPLARYLSAFGSKCVVSANTGKVEGEGKDCKGDILWTEVSMEAMVQAFEERVQDDYLHGEPANNSHWLPMTKALRACGMDKFHPSLVDFQGSIDGNANAEVKRMFQATGVTQAYPDSDRLVDKYFPPQRVSGHSSQTHSRRDLFYRKTGTVRAVASLYDEDYKRLNLTLPPELSSARPA